MGHVWLFLMLEYQVSFTMSPTWSATKTFYCLMSSSRTHQLSALRFGPPHQNRWNKSSHNHDIKRKTIVNNLQLSFPEKDHDLWYFLIESEGRSEKWSCNHEPQRHLITLSREGKHYEHYWQQQLDLTLRWGHKEYRWWNYHHPLVYLHHKEREPSIWLCANDP